ncbi:MAG: hypothetical protein JWP27_1583 [Flaviaesturariibacter sp.]|nr:hypothetical protein [Flaviaesturariibacter sp.]
MLKRTRGYVLLTLLVLTGFAGQVSNQTISSRERHELVAALKTSRTSLLESLDGLTDAQLDFRPGSGTRTIRESAFLLRAAQKELVAAVEASGGPRRSTASLSLAEFLRCHNGRFACPSSKAPVANQLKETESFLIKYARTTTEDLHAQPVSTSAGTIDGYHALLRLPEMTRQCVASIRAVKAHPGFPREL